MNAALRLSIKQWAPQDRPSDKLQNLGAEQMSDAELISLLVGCGTAQLSAVDVANNILRKFGNNLNALGKARFDELEDIEGVGVQTACKIMAGGQRWTSAGAGRWQQRSLSPTWVRLCGFTTICFQGCATCRRRSFISC